jgi:hypothetical protein
MIKMFVIRDLESQTHSPAPLGFNSIRDAKEALRDLANDEKTTIGKHPSDFRLIQIGEYDPREGIMLPQDHVYVCWANELVEQGEGQ